MNWYCLKAKTKREHFAAKILKARAGFEIFSPRINYTKKTVTGPKRFTEALFPGYLFCRFDLEHSAKLVSHSQDIVGIVKFGTHTPIIPDSVIARLQQAIPTETAEIKPPRLSEGELVEIVQGCFAGESGQVVKLIKGSDRAQLLIEFLGNMINVDVPSDQLVSKDPVSPGVALGLEASTPS